MIIRGFYYYYYRLQVITGIIIIIIITGFHYYTCDYYTSYFLFFIDTHGIKSCVFYSFFMLLKTNFLLKGEVLS